MKVASKTRKQLAKQSSGSGEHVVVAKQSLWTEELPG
jgi:hypothetical protein